MFVSARKDTPDRPAIICEDCYRKYYYGDDSYTKAYKHSILREAITPEVGRKVCRCPQVARHDGTGRPIELFPLADGNAAHTNVKGMGSIQCSLLKLGESAALAKYKGLHAVVDARDVKTRKADAKAKPKPKNKDTKVAVKQERGKKEVLKNGVVKDSLGDDGKTKMSRNGTGLAGKPSPITLVTGTSAHDPNDREAVSNTTSVAKEASADRDIPLFFRKYTEKYPFGNVHMALRVGPLVIENGVSQ
jgi:hypothetical protein